MAERTVNERQLEVLRWIVDGCPPGVINGTSHKVTALALRTRRLAVVSRKGGRWSAQATDAGRFFVENGAYPPGHWTVGPRRRMKGSVDRSEPTPVKRPVKTPASRSVPTPVERSKDKVTGLRPVDQMIADVVAAGGELVVRDARYGEWERLAASAARFHKVPDGKLIKIDQGESWDVKIIRLEDRPAWMAPESEPVRVSEQLRSPHESVRTLRDDRSRLRLHKETRTRALRILDAIAKAAEARGHKASLPKDDNARHRDDRACLVLTIIGHDQSILIDELHDKVPHEPTKQELRDKERYSWTRIPTHDHVPSGRLRLMLSDGRKVGQDRFADTKTATLESRLGAVLEELELRAAAAQARAEQRERERRAREAEWKRIRDQAEIRVIEEHRASVLLQEAAQWRQTGDLDAYLEAMADTVGNLDGEAKASGEAWLAWSRDFRRRLDPLSLPVRMPADPKVTAETLRPFMRGHSPHGPGW